MNGTLEDQITPRHAHTSERAEVIVGVDRREARAQPLGRGAVARGLG